MSINLKVVKGKSEIDFKNVITLNPEDAKELAAKTKKSDVVLPGNYVMINGYVWLYQYFISFISPFAIPLLSFSESCFLLLGLLDISVS